MANWAQDSRQVTEPQVPPACAVLVAQASGPVQKTDDDQGRLQKTLDHCTFGHSVHLAQSNEFHAFTSGPLSLPTGVTLVVEPGVTLYASTDPARYDRGGKSCGTLDRVGHGCRPFITALNTEHSGLMGKGTIDGQGGQVLLGHSESWWQLARRAQREVSEHNVPRLIEINQSKEFVLYQIRLANSPNFHVTLNGVDGFTAWGVVLDTPSTARNTDGIDPISSRNITIAHSFIATGDDGVAIKSNATGPSEKISVIDNHFYNGHGMSIGSETYGGVHDVLVSQLSMEGSTSGLRIKSNASRGGKVERIRYEKICLRDVKVPIDFSAFYNNRSHGDLIPVFQGIELDTVTSLTPGDVILMGFSQETPIQVGFKEVWLTGQGHNQVMNAQTFGKVQFRPANHFDSGRCADQFPLFPKQAQDTATVASSPPRSRPQLTAAQVEHYRMAEVLSYAGLPGHERLDPWDPSQDDAVVPHHQPADYEVNPAHADGVRQFQTIQAAVNRAVQEAKASGRQAPIRVLIQPGRYEELVYVPALPAPIWLIGAGERPQDTVISASLEAADAGTTLAQRYGGEFSQADVDIQAMFDSLKSRPHLTTFGTATLWSKNSGFHLKNLTVENAYVRPDPVPPGMHQAVALMLDGADRSVFDHVRLLGLQDTLYLKAGEGGRTARSLFVNDFIQGDVDFVFGDATAYFYQSEIKTLGGREQAYVAAPSTHVDSRYGFVFDQVDFTHDNSPIAGQAHYRLARQWFHNQRCTPYGPMPIDGYTCQLGAVDGLNGATGTIRVETLKTVGKVVVMNSRLGSHLSPTHPWSDWNQPGKLSFRPVQYDRSDFLQNLQQAFPGADLSWVGQNPDPIAAVFLAEYQNQGL
jgi:polygalacturonase